MKPNKTIPKSIRFTEEELAACEQAKGNLSLSAYVRSCVLGKSKQKLRRRNKNYNPSKTRMQLAQILALLGKSKASGALREILDLARMGALPITPELETKIEAACDDIKSIKQMLIKALGLNPKG